MKRSIMAIYDAEQAPYDFKDTSISVQCYCLYKRPLRSECKIMFCPEQILFSLLSFFSAVKNVEEEIDCRHLKQNTAIRWQSKFTEVQTTQTRSGGRGGEGSSPRGREWGVMPLKGESLALCSLKVVVFAVTFVASCEWNLKIHLYRSKTNTKANHRHLKKTLLGYLESPSLLDPGFCFHFHEAF